MTQGEQGYKWVNRQEFPNHGIQQLGDYLSRRQTPQEEQRAVVRLFQRMLQRSGAALVILNDGAKQVELYGVPSSSMRFLMRSDSAIAMKRFSDARHYFQYGAEIGRLFGQRGTFVRLLALRDTQRFDYGVQVVRSLWQRLDKYTSCNRDKIGLFWRFPKNQLYDKLLIKLYRESRGNYLDFKTLPAQGQKIFGQGLHEANVLKQSNLLGLSVDWTRSFAHASVSAGWDYGNSSSFLSWGGGLSGVFSFGRKLQLGMTLKGAQVIGRNLLKNDLLFRNTQDWPGNRSNNFISPRMELLFKEYPYFSFLGLKPYLYTQAWAVLRKNEAGRVGSHLEFQYGLGVTTNGKSRVDISLFRCSADKERGIALGEVKLTF